MPTTCEGCRYYSPADAAVPCPECGRSLKFTLLPPPDFTDSADVPDEPPPVRRPPQDAASTRGMLYEWLTSMPVLAVLSVVVYVLLLARLWVVIARGAGDPDFAPK